MRRGQPVIGRITQLLHPGPDLTGKDPLPQRGGGAVVKGADNFSVRMVNQMRSEPRGAVPCGPVQVVGKDRVEIRHQETDFDAARCDMGQKLGPVFEAEVLCLVASQTGSCVKDAERQKDFAFGGKHDLFQRGKHLCRRHQR